MAIFGCNCSEKVLLSASATPVGSPVLPVCLSIRLSVNVSDVVARSHIPILFLLNVLQKVLGLALALAMRCIYCAVHCTKAQRMVQQFCLSVSVSVCLCL